MREFKVLIAALSVLCSVNAYAITDGLKKDSTSGSGLSFRLKGIAFFRNNEYYSPVVEGYTLTGWSFTPELVWSLSERTGFSFGTHILYYSGEERKTRPELRMTVSHRIGKNSVLYAGSLPGSESHILPDPLFSSEKKYTDPTENGIQFVSSGRYFRNDTWIDWRKFIFRGDTVREEFTAGESLILNIPVGGSKVELEAPVSLIFNHWGGQISNYSGHVITTANISGGLRIIYRPEWIGRGSVSAEYMGYIFRELTKKGDFGTVNGNASFIGAGIDYSIFSVTAGYWKASDFFSPTGNPIFGSVPDFTGGNYTGDRKILTLSGAIKYKPEPFFELLLGYEGFYNLNSSRFDNALTLHLKTDRLFSLIKNFRR